jgi:hypothetical protein
VCLREPRASERASLWSSPASRGVLAARPAPAAFFVVGAERDNRKAATMRVKIAPLAGVLVGMLALSGVTTASASAACMHGGAPAEHHTLCIEGQQAGSASSPSTTSFSVVQKTGSSQVFNNPSGAWSVTCTTLQALEHTIESGGANSVKAKLWLNLNGCTVQVGGHQQPSCSVEEIYTSREAGAFGSPIENLKLTPSTGEQFMEISITGGSCALAQTYWVYGSQECTVKQAETETATKELLCEAAKSSLTLRHGQGGAVTLALDGTVELAGTSKGKKFSFVN